MAQLNFIWPPSAANANNLFLAFPILEALGLKKSAVASQKEHPVVVQTVVMLILNIFAMGFLMSFML